MRIFMKLKEVEVYKQKLAEDNKTNSEVLGFSRPDRFWVPRASPIIFCHEKKVKRRCRASNPGHPRDRREYLPLYYNDFVAK